MARRREPQEGLGKTKRISPYQQMADEYDEVDQTQDFDDVYDEEYEGEYESEQEEADEPQGRGFFSTVLGKIVLAVIALLFVALIALVLIRFLNKPDDAEALPTAQPAATQQPVTQQSTTSTQQSTTSTQQSTTATQQSTATPGVIVFAPVQQTTEPTTAPTQTPTAEPEPTNTPLPIILTNTPTPSPSPTPTPTPTATPVPTNTPTPEPTAVPSIAKGEVNRDANLRESAASNAKVKQTVDQGEAVTIHESLLDKSGKVWYHLTVDDLAVTGYMRDYVVDLADKIAKPTYTPKPEETPKADEAAAETETESSESDAAQTQVSEEEVLAVGETNRDANLRKVMNGTVLGTIKEGKRVSIYEVLKDKNGNTWYRLSVDDTNKAGYMRDFVIDLEDEAELEPETAVTRASVGTAKTNRAANVRKTPASDGAIVRQISKGTKIYITGKYEDVHRQTWYQISTESGNTTGYMRDYVLDDVKLDNGVETQTYQGETADASEERTAQTSNTKWKYAGNKSSKVLHELNCDSLSSSSDNLVYFESRSYAINIGYKPCENCNP
ncbi:MAG: SH3 domain-containing protein [Clostridia bacterium]|nr:SH3 domain-containing protein [Clostridia bacterium]